MPSLESQALVFWRNALALRLSENKAELADCTDELECMLLIDLHPKIESRVLAAFPEDHEFSVLTPAVQARSPS